MEVKQINHYEVLGIPRNCGETELRRAYLTKALMTHPDKNKDPDAHHKFLAIKLAYQILNNPEERGKYDRGLDEKPSATYNKPATGYNPTFMIQAIDSFTALRKFVFVGPGSHKMLFNATYASQFSDTTHYSSEFKSKIIYFNGESIKFQLCDSAEQERFRGIFSAYARNTSAMIINIDASNRGSLKAAATTIDRLKENSVNCLLGLVINKDSHEAVISDDEINEFCEQNGIPVNARIEVNLEHGGGTESKLEGFFGELHKLVSKKEDEELLAEASAIVPVDGEGEKKGCFIQ